MNNPFFTIITASFNNKRTLEKTIMSLLSQFFRDFEHIVIDGGSNDQTVQLLENHKKTYNLKWISEPDEGIADALNKGLKLANGKYILIIHADDYLVSPKTLLLAYDVLKHPTWDIYSSPVWVERQKKKIMFKPFPYLWWHHFKTIFPHQGCFVHKRVFDTIGGFNPKITIGMDYEFFYRALKHNVSIKFGKQPVAVMGGNGISNDRNLLQTRLNEEFCIQQANETNRVWKMIQLIYRKLYRPYKLMTQSFVPGRKTQLKK